MDIVFLQRDTDPVLRFEIFRTGHLVYERTESRIVAERVMALKLFADDLPLRRMRRDTLLQAEGR